MTGRALAAISIGVLIMSIAEFLSGCLAGAKLPGNTGAAEGAVPLPEGTHVTRLYVCQYSSMIEPTCVLAEKDGGVYMKLTLSVPYCPYDEVPEDEDSRFYGVETVYGEEYASSVKLTGEDMEDVLSEIAGLVEQAGALKWESLSAAGSPFKMDGDTGAGFCLELSDGTVVDISCSGRRPNGWNSFYAGIMSVFKGYADFSRYKAADFTESECDKLCFEYRSRDGSSAYRLELSGTRWIIALKDSSGELLEEGTDISAFGDSDELPFGRFVDIFKKHGAESWKDGGAGDPKNTEYFRLSLFFVDGREFTARGSVLPDGFDELKKELAPAIKEFYEEMKQETA